MIKAVFTRKETALVDAIVLKYEQEGKELAKYLAEGLSLLCANPQLAPLVHSIKFRVKDPTHLRDKLARKLLNDKSSGSPFSITPENLFEKITDLAGVRILHLHTSQFPKINLILLRLLDMEEYKIIEGPVARVWDGEYANFFRESGIEIEEQNERLYTSVHYIVSSGERNLRTGEIQVRTLAEELWGEVDHSMNYPHASPVSTCREQIRVLARITSGATRLVDSIFRAKEEAEALLAVAPPVKPRRLKAK